MLTGKIFKNLYQEFTSLSYLKAVLVMLISSISFFCTAQEHHSNANKAITSDFEDNNVLFDRSTIITNVLKIKNNNGKVYKLHLHMNVPRSWKSLVNEDRIIEIHPGDSIFVPVRVVPNFNFVSGSTKYSINVTILTVDGRVMSTSFFFANKPVISNWQTKILPRPRMYFLNDENSANFQVELSNDGDEPKNVLLSLSTIGKGVSLYDSLQRDLRKNYIEFFLNPYSDTLVPFSVQIEKMKRNFRSLDIDSYRPDFLEEGKNYMVFVKAGEIGNSVRMVDHNQKVDFIKLNNDLKLNQYGAPVIPLTADLNVYNLLSGTEPVTNLNLYGNTHLDSKALVTYQMQTNLSGLSSNSVLKQTYGSIGYYAEKGYLQAGNTGVGLYGIQGLGGGVGGGGLGVSGGYYFTPVMRISGYISDGSNNSSLQHRPNYGFGFQDAIAKLVKYAVAYKHSDNGFSFRSDVLEATANINLGHSQGISFSDATAFNTDYIKNSKTHGNSIGMNYSGTYFKRKLTTDINFTNSDKNYSTTGLANFNATANTFFRTNKTWNLSLQNQYSEYENYYASGASILTEQNKTFYNQLNFNKRAVKDVTINYFLFYNYTDYSTTSIGTKGAGVNGNYYKAEDNLRIQMLFKGGYNKQITDGLESNYFSAQFFSLISYHTLFFNINYNYSAQTVTDNSISSIPVNYPQQLLLSLSHQLQVGKQVIWENNINYNYLSTLDKNSIGAFSSLYFYTYTGWRLKLEGGYNMSSSLAYQYDNSGGQTQITSSNSKVSSTSFQLNIGLRKQFGINIPKKFAKQKFCNVKFVAFLDMNGNKIMDKDEVPLENIVIRLNDNEILTNKSGEATFENASWGMYRLQAFSLVDLGAWFPVVSDSIYVSNLGTAYIPFSKGIKVQGSIDMQREKYSGQIFDDIDLSKIKITLTDSSGRNTVTSITDKKGNFNFYVPYGSYTMAMDESVLSSSFTISQNNISVELLDGMDNFYYTFFIIENKRKVTKKKFNENGELISENTDVSDVFTGNKDENKKDGLQDTVAILKRDQPKNTKEIVQNYKLKEIDDNIHRLDSMVIILLKNSVSGFYTAFNFSETPIRKMSPSEINQDKKKLLFTIEVAYYPTGDNLLRRFLQGKSTKDKTTTSKEASLLLDGIKTGKLKWYFHPDGSTSIVSGNFITQKDANAGKSNLKKMGYPGSIKIKAIYQNKLITLDEANKIRK